MNTIRVKILMPTRADLRLPGAEQADVQSVNPGEVYDLVVDTARQLMAFAAAEPTKEPTTAQVLADKKLKDAAEAAAKSKEQPPAV